MTRKLILGLDIGTSSVRAALYDLTGTMLPETFVKNERLLTATGEGGLEIDADIALKQVIAAIDDVLTKSTDIDGEIEYVASCAFWHSLVGVDAKGKPTTKVLSWADTRSRNYTAVLRKQFDEPTVHNRTGARFHSSFWPAKLLWQKKENTKAFSRTAKWLSFSDYVSMKLNRVLPFEKVLPSIRLSKQEWQHAGVPTTSVAMASATGLSNIRECNWDEELLDYLGLHEFHFSRIVGDDEHRELNREFSRRWPRLKNSWWFSAIGDGAANNIGAGCVNRSRAALMIGTSGAIRVAYAGEPPAKIPSGLWCYRIDWTRVVIGGALSDGGGLYARLKKSLRIDIADADIGREMARRGADAHGLTVMPFFAGERSTGYNENAAGSIMGLRSSHDAIDILQAAMEGVAFRFAEILDQLKQIAPVKEIIASGGALESSPVWTQIIADVLGRDLHVFTDREASMRGAVLLALESLGKIENIQRGSTKTVRTEFHAACHKIYRAARKRHIKHYTILNSEK